MNRDFNNIWFVNSFRLFATLQIFFMLTSVTTHAQENNIEKTLLRSIEQTRQQLEAERERIEQEQQSQEKDLKEAIARQEQLVDEIVERKFAIAHKEAEQEEKRSDREKLRRQQNLFRQQWTEVRIIAADACQKLSDSFDTLPISESRRQQKKLLAEIKSSLGKVEQTQIDVSPLLELLESLLQESRTTAVFEQNIRDAQGYERQVQLLRLGQILFAYRSPSEQIAIAASTSGDEKGFRWNEDIPQWARRKISFAIDNAMSKGGICSLPIDVTQQLAVEQRYYKHGFWGKLAAGGPVMIPLVIVAILALILIVEKFVFLSKQGGNTIKVAEDVLAACHAGNFRKADNIAIENPGVISRTMLACLSRRLEDTTVMEDAIAEAILHELPNVERFLPSIGILAGVAPLLGLLGTVTGMISTFDTITIFGSGQPRLMAGGISEALITTATGLVIAIPVLLIHSFLSSRCDRLLADTERFSATLLNLLSEQPVKSAQHNDNHKGKKNETTD
jgi:biopolymer transport protein ExbB